MDYATEELLRNPTIEGALEVYEKARIAKGWPYPKDRSKEITALAVIHKARLGWSKSTDQMLAESKEWLVAQGMSPTLRGKSR